MGVYTSHNNLNITGDFDRHALELAMSNLHLLCDKSGYEKVYVNFKDLDSIKSSEMLPFATYCRLRMVGGVEVILELPQKHKLRKLFENCNWAYLIDPRAYAQSGESHTHLPALIYKDFKEQHHVVDMIMELLLRQLPGATRDSLGALEWVINEITDNVLNHSESAIGGVVQVTLHKNIKMIEFQVCDGGLGIPKTLRSAIPSITSDRFALEKSIQEGVTRDKKTNAGNGLYGAFRVAQMSKGRFSIYSGYASLSIDRDGKAFYADCARPYNGTSIVCTINYADQNLLADALSFKEDSRKSTISIIDKYNAMDSIVINMIEECPSFGSRDAARPIKIKILTLLSQVGGSITIDLSGINVISSSFADEVFGMIFMEMGPVRFMNKIRIVGTNGVVGNLIDRAITQRMASFSGS